MNKIKYYLYVIKTVVRFSWRSSKFHSHFGRYKECVKKNERTSLLPSLLFPLPRKNSSSSESFAGQNTYYSFSVRLGLFQTSCYCQLLQKQKRFSEL